jgi:hypothetical protein
MHAGSNPHTTGAAAEPPDAARGAGEEVPSQVALSQVLQAVIFYIFSSLSFFLAHSTFSSICFNISIFYAHLSSYISLPFILSY